MSLVALLHHVAYFKYVVRNPYQSYPVFSILVSFLFLITRVAFLSVQSIIFGSPLEFQLTEILLNQKARLIISRHCSFDSYIQLF